MSLAIYNGTALALSGSNLVLSPLAAVTVRREDTGALASIFSDRAGAAGLSNPMTADAYGRFTFHAAGIADGYRVTVTEAASPGLEYTLRYQAVGLAAELDLTSFVTASQFTKGGIPVGTSSGAQGNKAAGTDGYVLVPSSAASAGLVWMPPGLGYNLVGGYFIGSPAGSPNGDLLIQLKTWSGADPSDAEPVFIRFHSATANNGLPVDRKITSATSFTIQNGSTYGVTSAKAFRLWLVAFDDGGTVRLAPINCLATSANAGAGLNVDSIYPLSGFGIASAVFEGGSPSGLADSAGVFYSNATISSKAYTILGYMEWGEVSGSPSEAGLVLAGNWVRAPTRHQLFGPGVPLPGQAVQTVHTHTSAVATGTTALPHDDTIPQSGEGVQFLSLAITPSSAANVLDIQARLHVNSDAGSEFISTALFQDSVANAIAAFMNGIVTASFPAPHLVSAMVLAGLTAATTFKVRSGTNSTSNLTFNGITGARRFGGVGASVLRIQEIMG